MVIQKKQSLSDSSDLSDQVLLTYINFWNKPENHIQCQIPLLLQMKVRLYSHIGQIDRLRLLINE